MSIKKMYCNESRKSLIQELSFEVSLFGFHFACFILFSLYLKLPLKPAFFSVFCYFWKDISLLVLNLFISEYLDQIPP